MDGSSPDVHARRGREERRKEGRISSGAVAGHYDMKGSMRCTGKN